VGLENSAKYEDGELSLRPHYAPPFDAFSDEFFGGLFDAIETGGESCAESGVYRLLAAARE